MRENKFRGKCTNEHYREFGQWVFGGIFECERYTVITVEDRYDGSLYEPPHSYLEDIEVNPETVGQYTGLLDKNSVEIYDGDIVKVEHSYADWGNTGKIFNKPRRSYGGEEYTRDYDLARCYKYYRNYKVEFNVVKQTLEIRNGSDCHALTCHFIRAHKVDVIGNIYDNPELIEISK